MVYTEGSNPQQDFLEKYFKQKKKNKKESEETKMASYNARCLYGGYYEKYVRVSCTERMPEHESAQCGIIKDEYGTHLISYETLICSISPDGILSATFNPAYSRTTAKHVGWFMKYYAPAKYNYYTVKWCYENDMTINLNTGEIAPLYENADLQLNDYDFEERN